MAIGGNINIGIQTNLATGTTKRLQAQLDAISKRLVLNIGKVKIQNQQFTKSIDDAMKKTAQSAKSASASVENEVKKTTGYIDKFILRHKAKKMSDEEFIKYGSRIAASEKFKNQTLQEQARLMQRLDQVERKRAATMKEAHSINSKLAKESEKQLKATNKSSAKDPEKQLKNRQSYEQWWSKALDSREQKENKAAQKEIKLAQTREQWWLKNLKFREIAESKASQRLEQSRQKEARSYEQWWGKALKSREAAENKTSQRLEQRRQSEAKSREQAEAKASMAYARRKTDAYSSVTPYDDIKKSNVQAKLSSQISSAQNKLSDMSGNKLVVQSQVVALQNRFRELGSTISSISNNRMAQQWSTDFSRANTQLRTFNAGFQEARRNAGGLGTEILDAGKKMMFWAVIGTAIFGTFNQIKNGVGYIVEMDAALTSLAKVVDLSKEKLGEMSQSAVETGKKLGASSVDIMRSYAEFGRVNKNPEEIKKLSTAAVLASNVTTLTAEDAAKAINTTMIVFKKNANESIDIIDKWNELQNNFRKNYAEYKFTLIDLEVPLAG
jgi:hypothetical protein